MGMEAILLMAYMNYQACPVDVTQCKVGNFLWVMVVTFLMHFCVNIASKSLSNSLHDWSVNHLAAAKVN